MYEVTSERESLAKVSDSDVGQLVHLAVEQRQRAGPLGPSGSSGGGGGGFPR